MPEIPCDQIIDLMERGQSDMNSIGKIFAVKDAARYVSVSEDSDLLIELKTGERFYQIQVS